MNSKLLWFQSVRSNIGRWSRKVKPKPRSYWMTPSVAPICHQKWISWVGDGSENPQDIAQANSKGVKLKNGSIHSQSQFPFYKTQKIFSFYNKKGFVFIILQPRNIFFAPCKGRYICKIVNLLMSNFSSKTNTIIAY